MGVCARCGLNVPSRAIDGSEAIEGLDYKQVLGDPEIVWHHLHPAYEDCYGKETRDPDSEWYELNYLDEDDVFCGSLFEDYYEELIEDD